MEFSNAAKYLIYYGKQALTFTIPEDINFIALRFCEEWLQGIKGREDKSRSYSQHRSL